MKFDFPLTIKFAISCSEVTKQVVFLLTKTLRTSFEGYLMILIKYIEMGRPKKELTSLKIIQVNIRMTVDDYIKVSDNAETIGLSVAEYVRRKTTERSLPKKRVSPLDRKFFVELSRVGNNLNQLAKVVNSGIHEFSIQRQLEEVKTVLQYLKSNIANHDR